MDPPLQASIGPGLRSGIRHGRQVLASCCHGRALVSWSGYDSDALLGPVEIKASAASMGRMETVYNADDRQLGAGVFLELVQRVWPGRYDRERVQEALHRTINITAVQDGKLVGCVRILSDGYFFGTVPEILVDPDFQGRGIGRRLMEMVWEASPTGLFLGSQPGNEGFFERLGYEKGLQSYQRKKPRS